VLEDADHSFHVPARSGRKSSDVLEAALDALCTWLGDLGGPRRNQPREDRLP